MPTINNPQDPTSPLFVTRNGRLIANYDLDLARNHSYSIDNTPILSLDTLGVTVVTSNLRKVGTLENLEVSGDALLGGFAVFNSTYNRLGIGTDGPCAAIDILENNVETIIGSPKNDITYIGTYSNHNVAIITDNQERIVVKNTGAVQLNGDVTISGTLTVSSVVTDTRVDRTQTMTFLPSKDTSIFGLGLAWVGPDRTRQLTMVPGDVLLSTENIGVSANKGYLIGGESVLTSTILGSSVTSSSLTKIGTLDDLTVQGPINASKVTLNTLSLTNTGIEAEQFVKISIQDKDAFYGDQWQVVIGDSAEQSKPVKVFGSLSINVNNPDTDVELTVNGDVSLGGKRFTTGTSAPIGGTWHNGDICWNTNPIPHSYIGWTCIVAGSPGQWAPFGLIADQ